MVNDIFASLQRIFLALCFPDLPSKSKIFLSHSVCLLIDWSHVFVNPRHNTSLLQIGRLTGMVSQNGGKFFFGVFDNYFYNRGLLSLLLFVCFTRNKNFAVVPQATCTFKWQSLSLRTAHLVRKIIGTSVDFEMTSYTLCPGWRWSQQFTEERRLHVYFIILKEKIYHSDSYV